MEVILKKRKTYPWTKQEDTYFRGYILINNGTVKLTDVDAAVYFQDAETFDGFCAKLKAVKGLFSVIRRVKDNVWAAVDDARSMPLYYDKGHTLISDSSEIVRIYAGIEKESADPYRLMELFRSRCIAGPYTVYCDIMQIDMAHAVEFAQDRENSVLYYTYFQPTKDYSDEQYIQMITDLSDRCFRETKLVIGNRPVVLSLSSGYDSRYVACMLKKIGIDKVICYTYGRKDSFEIEPSRRIAKELGFQWFFVEYDDSHMEELMKADIESFMDATSEHDYSMHIQHYYAIKKLKADGVIPDNAVMILGLGTDVPTGAHVPLPEHYSDYSCTREGVAHAILKYRNMTNGIKKEAVLHYIREVENVLNEIDAKVQNHQDFVRIHEYLQTVSLQSRYYLHMNDVFDYFGYEWILPGWNRMMLEFWDSVPYEKRVNRELFEKWLLSVLCKPFGEETSKKKYKGGYAPLNVVKKKAVAASVVLHRIALNLGLPTDVYMDINNFKYSEVQLYRKITQKKLLNIKNTNFSKVVTLYIMEQRYGHNFYKAVKEHLC